MIDYKENLARIDPKWQGVTLENATDEQIDELFEEIHRNGGGINLGIPCTSQNINSFLSMINCENCGKCCERGDMGIILSPDEVDRLADQTQMSNRKFKDTHTNVEDGKRFLKYPCLFYDNINRLCKIYSSRPKVCRLYPVNQAEIAMNFGVGLDGIPLMIIHSGCDKGREVAGKILKDIVHGNRNS